MAVYESGVRLESNGDYWRAAWTDRHGRRRRKGLGPKSELSKRAARAMCLELERKYLLRPGARNVSRAPRLRDYTERYLKLREGEVSEGTLSLDRNTADALTAYFDNPRIDAITRADADDWRAWLKTDRKVTETTACGYSRRAKTMFNRAVRRDELDGRAHV